MSPFTESRAWCGPGPLLLAAVLLAAVTTWGGGGTARAQSHVDGAKAKGKARSPQEEKRRKLLEQIGLDPASSSPHRPPASSSSSSSPASGTAVPEPAPADAEPPAPARASGGKASSTTDRTGEGEGNKQSGSPAPSFRRAVHPLLMAVCASCHRGGGPAGMTRLVLTGDATVDHGVVARLVNTHAPAASPLLTKAAGVQPHGGGAPWTADSAAHVRVLAWIARGARLDGGTSPSASAAAVAAAAAPPGSPAVATGARPAPVSAGGTPGRRLSPPRHPSSEPVLPLSPTADEADTAAPAPSPDATPDLPSDARTATAASPPGVDFATAVHPLLMTSCATCHRANGPAAATRLIFSGDPASDLPRVKPFVQPDAPAQSLLLTKAAGTMHGGGVILPAGDPRHELLLSWATPPAVRAAATAGVGQPPAPAPGGGADREPVLSTPPAGAAPAPTNHPGYPGGIALPLGFLLNGRFDLNYERRQFSGAPFGSGGVNALRSYHHFLFLSRAQADEPCAVSLEVLTLQFWEVNCRVMRQLPVELSVAAGKLLVPFGADPLYHQSYGGLAGFDQRMLPPIWATEGISIHLVHQRGGWVFTDDLFVVRGYTLARADAVLNLQNDFSPADDARLGWGNRLGAAWRGISAWYSTYFNELGFQRRLFMQALDVTVWRQRDLPVVGHFSAGAGLLRADVSGGDDGSVGGPGRDYYHFGSYFQLRYHPTDWLFAQYRQGLRTFDNRRGVILDNSRLTSADGSTHSFGVVARYHGLTGGVFYFVNLEKVDEVPDDLLRVSVTYDF